MPPEITEAQKKLKPYAADVSPEITESHKNLKPYTNQDIACSLCNKFSITAISFTGAAAGVGLTAAFLSTAVLGSVGVPMLIAVAAVFAAIALSPYHCPS